MKKNILFISLSFILIFCLSFTFFNTNSTQANVYAENNNCFKIKVLGCGQTSVKPDYATIKFSINTIGEDINLIKEENTTKTNEIITKLESLNVKKENIKSISYSIFQKYEYSGGEQVYLGNQISNLLEVKTEDLNSVTTIVSSLTENGVDEVLSINLGITDNESAYNDALKNALENATKKAQALSNNTKLTTCKIYEEGFMCNLTNLARYDAKSVISEDKFSQILENEICIKANIVVEFCSCENLAVDNTNNNTLDNTNKESGTISTYDTNIENNTTNSTNNSTNQTNKENNVIDKNTNSVNENNSNENNTNSATENNTPENNITENDALTDEILNNNTTNLEN